MNKNKRLQTLVNLVQSGKFTTKPTRFGFISSFSSNAHQLNSSECKTKQAAQYDLLAQMETADLIDWEKCKYKYA